MEDGADFKKSTTTLYYQQRSQSARPARVSRVPAGPGVKLVGGTLQSAYDERPKQVSMGHTADSAAIQQAYFADTRAANAGADGVAATMPARPSTSLGFRTKKVVYWDGKSHHIVDAPATQQSESHKWSPPHLMQGDVVPGPQLGVRETPAAARVKLIGGKYRYLPTMEPFGTSKWAISPEEASKYGTVGYTQFGNAPAAGARDRGRSLGATGASMEDYARTRSIGYKEYEAATKMLNGVGSWERTQQHLYSSVSVGRPSRLVSAGEHMKTLTSSGRFTGLAAAK